ncbi:MAG: hypothetical protein RLZZ37_1109 [Actinomycetota bacterium]
MALTLIQKFESNLDLNQLKKVIQNDEFQKLRNKETNLINYEIQSNITSQFTIKKVLEIDLASNISAMVTNPFEITEVWNLEEKDKILVIIKIPKIQTTIEVELIKNGKSEFQVKSEIKSTVFMMGSFVEEHVAKFWKKLVQKDFQLLTSWPINQI